MLLIWTDNLSVGIKAFDDDHKRMIRIINELHHEVVEGKIRGKVSPEEIEIQLHRLQNYTIYHCALEEKVLEVTGYPNLEAHKQEHAELIAKIADMSLRFRRSTNPADAEEIMNFAYEWLRDHIFTQDREYVEHLRGRHLFPDESAPGKPETNGILPAIHRAKKQREVPAAALKENPVQQLPNFADAI